MALLHGDTVLQAGWKLDDAMAAATLTLVISSLWHDGLGGFRVTISEIETTSDYEDEKSDPYDAGAAWDHEYKGTCAAEGQELRWLVADWKGKGHFDGLPPPDAALKGNSESVSSLKLQLPRQAGRTWLTLQTQSG